MARLELPAATSQHVVTFQQDIQTRARVIQTNRDRPAADRATQLEALQAEATAKLTTSLTARCPSGRRLQHSPAHESTPGRLKSRRRSVTIYRHPRRPAPAARQAPRPPPLLKTHGQSHPRAPF